MRKVFYGSIVMLECMALFGATIEPGDSSKRHKTDYVTDWTPQETQTYTVSASASGCSFVDSKTKASGGAILKSHSSSSASAEKNIEHTETPNASAFGFSVSGVLAGSGNGGEVTWSVTLQQKFYWLEPFIKIIPEGETFSILGKGTTPTSTKWIISSSTGKNATINNTDVNIDFKTLWNELNITVPNDRVAPLTGEYTVSAESINESPNRTASPSSQVYVFHITPQCPEIYMLVGHENDKISFSCTPNVSSSLSYEWSISNSSLGDFNNPTIAAPVFMAKKAGGGTIKLKVNDVEVYSRPIEIIAVKPRSAWGAASYILADMSGGMDSINAITVHHAGSTQREDTTASIKAIQTDHIGKEYGDIAYHFVLLRGGSFYEGRTLEGIYSGQYTKGAHVASNNTAAGIGLLVLGDFGETSLLNPFIDVFSTSIKKNLEKVLTGLCRRYGKNHNDLKYHQMFNSGTECPGIQIINAFSSIKNNVKENLN